MFDAAGLRPIASARATWFRQAMPAADPDSSYRSPLALMITTAVGVVAMGVIVFWLR
jgi:hypothetical protein